MSHRHHHSYLSRLSPELQAELARMRRIAGVGSILVIAMNGYLSVHSFSIGHIVQSVCSALSIGPVMVSSWLLLRRQPL